MRLPVFVISICIVGTVSWLSSARAQSDDWPCIQVLVPKVSAAVVWPVPLDEHELERWRGQLENEELVKNITNLYQVDESALEQLGQYIGHHEPAQHASVATGLFSVLLDQFNQKREHYIQGIHKFTKKQKTIADRLIELIEQRDKAIAEAQPHDELSDKIATVEQIFRNRNRLLEDLCEQPVRVEENLGEVARALAGHLE